YESTLCFFDRLLKLVHPFMPFITEELWQHIYERKDGESIMSPKDGDIVAVQSLSPAEKKLLADFEDTKKVVAGVRAVRNQKNIANKEQLALVCLGSNAYATFDAVVKKMSNLSSIEVSSESPEGAVKFLVGTSEYAVPIGNLIDVEAEIQKQEAELKRLEGFLIGVQKKLQNANFVAHAPEQVVALERKKQADAEQKIAAIKETLASLRK
ncbi:MAG: class I tRNA ligase family protein, partial [Bacteroidaceae bacterium]|nr:class I tRNA ligase family protein [Bacteroidaceae bacterium]